MRCGVMGYLLKDSAYINLEQCIEAIMMNKKYVSQSIQEFLVDYDNEEKKDKVFVKTKKILTPTERVILKLIAEGNTSAEIANLLFVSSNTIDNHRANMSKKLQLKGKNSLLKFVIQHKGKF